MVQSISSGKSTGRWAHQRSNILMNHKINWSLIPHRRMHMDHFTNEGDVRVRFAPSPTGQLHLGGLRTALYNFLFARSRRGTFVLRIEDTDQTRLVPGATEKLIENLEWAGIVIDEGPINGGDYGPYVQSMRLKHYKRMIKLLMEKGLAYPCFCTPRRLELLRKDAQRRRETPKYDNKCRYLSPEEVEEKMAAKEPYTIRFKLEGECKPWKDLVYGKISQNVVETEGDPILIKSDGFPTYHFANVVDDHLMKITHVLRGEEWQVSTSKHLLLYKAFGWEPPQFAHLPLLLNKDGTKLSKRQNDLHVANLRESGYFSNSVLNLLTSQGSAFNVKSTAGMNMQELIKHFNLSMMNNNSTKLDMDTIRDYNKLHLQRRLNDEKKKRLLISQLREKVNTKYIGDSNNSTSNSQSYDMYSDEYLGQLLIWATKDERITMLDDLLTGDFEFLWSTSGENILKTAELPKNAKGFVELIEMTKSSVEAIDTDDFIIETLGKTLKGLNKEMKLKFPQYMKFLRVVLSGLNEGPPVAEMMYILGKENTLKRLDHVFKFYKKTTNGQ